MRVMVIESDRGAAAEAVARLEDAGHEVHRCHEEGLGFFPCNGVMEPSTCPLASGVDVALLVRRHVHPRPTPLENGVSCALRVGLPLAEDGPAALDPYDPWVTARVRRGDVVRACAEAIDHGFDPLRYDIRARIDPLLQREGVDATAVALQFEPHGRALKVTVTGPLPETLKGPLGVRIFDAVRDSRRQFETVDVAISPELAVE